MDVLVQKKVWKLVGREIVLRGFHQESKSSETKFCHVKNEILRFFNVCGFCALYLRVDPSKMSIYHTCSLPLYNWTSNKNCKLHVPFLVNILFLEEKIAKKNLPTGFCHFERKTSPPKKKKKLALFNPLGKIFQPKRYLKKKQVVYECLMLIQQLLVSNVSDTSWRRNNLV